MSETRTDRAAIGRLQTSYSVRFTPSPELLALFTRIVYEEAAHRAADALLLESQGVNPS